MAPENLECAILFSDVAGSTTLYEKLGDSKAKDLIGSCLELMSEISARHEGIVIKTIGDEIMCRFPTANDAVNAACAIQEELEGNALNSSVPLSVRIGLHYGPAILEEGDVFGDAVNVAARMASIAKAGQIITTSDTYKLLSPALQEMSREFDKTAVKGKQEEMIIYEVIWEEEDVTRMAGFSTSPSVEAESLVMLYYGGLEKKVDENSVPFVIGRGSGCDLTIPVSLASRSHAKIEYRRGKYVFVDQSTNGTYIRLNDGREVYLRREELPLSSTGLISLGAPVDESNPNTLRYSCV